MLDREGDEYEPEHESDRESGRDREPGARDEHEPATDESAEELAAFEGRFESDAQRAESVVEEPVIDTDANGRILSETVESHAYVPTPSQDAEPAAADPVEQLPEAAAPPAAKAKGRAKAAKAPRARGSRGAAKADAAQGEESAAPAAGSEVDASEKPAKSRGRGSRAAKKPARRPPPGDAAPVEPAAQEVATPAAESQTVVESARPLVKISTDRHLIEDEPIAPEPPPRPRSFRDLDSIPDDYD